MKTQKELQEKMLNLERAINEINRAMREEYEDETTFRYSTKWELLWAAINLGNSLTNIKCSLEEMINQYYSKK